MIEGLRKFVRRYIKRRCPDCGYPLDKKISGYSSTLARSTFQYYRRCTNSHCDYQEPTLPF